MKRWNGEVRVEPVHVVPICALGGRRVELGATSLLPLTAYLAPRLSSRVEY